MVAMMAASAPRASADVSASRNTSRRTRLSGVALDIDIAGRRGSLADGEIRRWVRSMAGLATEYLGHFPVPTLKVEVHLQSGSRVRFGQHFRGRRVRVFIGRNTSASDLARDHILLHELLHTALPTLDRRHRWMREGLSTYLETVVRLRAGIVSPEQAWARFYRQMPSGLPRHGDRGLDRTPTWGRTYWGGALFWLMVDVELRQTTRGRHSVRTLLSGIVRNGGVARERWPMRRLLALARRVTGTRVLESLYRRLALRPHRVPLERLFRRLGVQQRGRHVELTRGPLAWLRRRIAG